ncbi:septum formation initiator family protein [Thiomicrorhabdus sp. ZW0627]|uniref:FtsB family cell division protein n=1 Tax=Thiomicrorhabdus sp. ZW0627 TaxID=3039774 RepID=UPI0024366FBC|nr:septum formation initiator family protein [Thiomicrorhabdus sp. ZW0627]MDG6772976.1 septum formation initiator family protein [Thiomicrorhabdus sp. ZW0627]
MKRLYLILGLILVILLARLLSSNGGVGELFSLQNQLMQLEDQLAYQKRQNLELSQQVKDLQTQDSSVETLARQTLGMIAKDEVFVEVIETKPRKENSLTEEKAEASLQNDGVPTNNQTVSQ